MKKALNDFIKVTIPYDEFALFMEMKNHFSKNHLCSFIEKTHQNYVVFTSPTIRSIKRREISDLWIIVSIRPSTGYDFWKN